jgi:hypothetical protein
MWSCVQAKVNGLGCKTFEEFKQAVMREVQAVPKVVLTNLFKSMGKRMAMVISTGGDKTKY